MFSARSASSFGQRFHVKFAIHCSANCNCNNPGNMAKSKVKEPKVALKGEKKSKAPKASVTARAKPSQLSEEAVVESGSESESGTSGGDSDTESEAEKRQNTKKPNEKKVKATEPLDVPVPSDDSSDSSSEEDDKKAKKTSKKSKDTAKTNGVKRKSDESSSEDSSDEDLPDAPEAKKPRTDSESSEEESDDEPQADKMDVDKPAPPPAGMVSSVTAKPFDALMGDAMAVMDHDMRTAPMNGQPAHDFMTMMIPHHQGAIDMAK